MKEVYIADCETDPFKIGRIPRPFIWGLYNGCEYYQFDTEKEFVEFIEDIDCICYAHNGGKFDWHYILPWVELHNPMTVINGRLSKFFIGDCEFRDSYNILPVPLREFNKDDFDYTILEKEVRDIPENRRKIERYLKNDCVYLYDAVMNFTRQYGQGLTIAGSALKVWKKITKTKTPETNVKFFDKFSKYYYGGRVQVFESGVVNEPFKVIDINSAYPYAMKHNHAWGNNYTTTTELPKTRAYIERSFITLKCVSKGALPWRDDKKALQFPDDDVEREYMVTGWEYLAGIDTGTITDVEIIKVITFNDSINFSEYVDHFYKLKEESKDKDHAQYIFAKLFLNSLYGKFGSNPQSYEEFKIIEQSNIYIEEQEGWRPNMPVGKNMIVSRDLPEENHTFYQVATAASITGFVRAMMWRSICACDGVLYCDTDSIFARDVSSMELDPVKLGAWDIEAECNYGAFCGKKLYAVKTNKGKWKKASKGAKLEPEQIVEIAEKNKEILYKPENPSYSIKSGIRFVNRKIRMTA